MRITVAATSAVLAAAGLSALPSAYAADLPPVVLVRDVEPTGNSMFDPLGATKGVVLFTASDSSHGEELWRSDGVGGATLVKDIYPGGNYSSPGDGAVLNNKVYFRANSPDEGTSLWVSDGTEAGTHLVKDINPGSHDGSLYNLTTFKGKIVFAAGPDSSDVDLWMSDGTTAGTKRIKDIDPVATSEIDAQTDDEHFAIANDYLYFAVYGTESGLWRTDLTSKGTRRIQSALGVGGFAGIGKTLYFSKFEGDRSTLWKSNGSASGTTFVADFGENAQPGQFTKRGKSVLFVVESPDGAELWKTNGTTDGTSHIVINESGSSDAGSLMTFGTRVLLSATDGSTGRELWISDGTTSGTTLVKDIAASGSSEPEPFIVKDGLAYFRADDGIFGSELWVTDGTPDGTEMLTDLFNGGTGSEPSLLTSPGSNFIYLSARDDIYGFEIHGVQLGTERLVNGSFETYPDSSNVPSKWVAKGFGAQDGQDTGAPDGSFAVRILGDGVTKSLSQKRAVVGKKYDRVSLSYLVAASDLPESRTCRVTVTLRDGAQKVGSRSALCPEGDYSYKEQSLVLVANKPFTTLTVTITFAADAGDVYWDRFSIIQ